jgi:hypothetical protein
MSTTIPKKQLTVEQKAKKNESAREKRLRDKEDLIQLQQREVEEQIPKAIEDDSDDYDDKPIEDVADEESPEEIRKREIAEKRRASLAIARSKIKPKSQITKEKDEEIAKIREENEKLKYETQKAKEVKPKIIKKYIIEETTPKHKSKSVPKEKREVERPREPSVDYLAQQSYAEQLQSRLRRDVYERVMMDTFM